MKVIIFSNTLWGIHNYRTNLIEKLVDKGAEIILLAPKSKKDFNLHKLGCKVHSIFLKKKSKNIFFEILTIINLLYFLYTLKPNFILNYTIKPVIYTSLIGFIFPKMRIINTITGIGSIFLQKGFTQNLITFLYRISHRKVYSVFFQNNDDIEFFRKKKIIGSHKINKVSGSGIDLKKFQTDSYPANDRIEFLFIGRLLEYKGIIKFLRLSEELGPLYPNVRFKVIGSFDDDDKKSISSDHLEYFIEKAYISYHSKVDNVKKYIEKSHCIILPSEYREGVPRALLEGASMSRPIITSNSVGCRDVVDNNVSGYLCNPNSYSDLKNKTIKFINLPYQKKIEMGKCGRKKMIAEFDVEKVVEEYLKTMKL